MRIPPLPGVMLLGCLGLSACSVGAGGFVANDDSGDLSNTLERSTATYQVLDLQTGSVTGRESIDDLGANLAYRTGLMVFHRVNAGSTALGSRSGQLGAQADEPASRGSFDAFYIGVFEVTQGQWQVLSARSGGATAPWTDAAASGVTGIGANYPAWALSQQTVEQTLAAGGLPLSLPSEVQWEAAARGGSGTDFWWSDDPDESVAGTRARVAETNGGGTGPAPVGGLAANSFALHDILGNVWELTSAGTIRGGSWHDTVLQARPANRIVLDPATAHALVGARLVLIP